jgi:hypothetical protein
MSSAWQGGIGGYYLHSGDTARICGKRACPQTG